MIIKSSLSCCLLFRHEANGHNSWFHCILAVLHKSIILWAHDLLLGVPGPHNTYASHAIYASWSNPRSSVAGTIRSVLVWPIPPRQPCTHTTASPRFRTPSFIALTIPHVRRLSTSSCHGTSLKSGFSSGNQNG